MQSEQTKDFEGASGAAAGLMMYDEAAVAQLDAMFQALLSDGVIRRQRKKRSGNVEYSGS